MKILVLVDRVLYNTYEILYSGNCASRVLYDTIVTYK